MRKPFVAGNWKMNMLRESGVELARAIAAHKPAGDIDVALCPPFVYLDAIGKAVGSSYIALGAQNVYFESEGAFTGEISTRMLKDIKCQWVILGHSERRHVMGEDDASVNLRLKATIESGLKPILCVGEKLEQRDANETEKVIETQLSGGLEGVSEASLASLVIAYEPVWAIGTGRTATPEQAQDVHKFIRNWLSEKFSPEFAEKTRIQYGGSVKPGNAKELMSRPDVDGALVGGASLKAEDFVKIIDAAC